MTMSVNANNDVRLFTDFVAKMKSMDKDFRFMAANDLMNELKKDETNSKQVPVEIEEKVVRAVLSLLSDNNGEIRSLSVNCLKVLILKISDSQKEIIVKDLCANILSKDENLRDVSFMGIKISLMQLPKTATCIPILLQLNSHLIDTIQNKDIKVTTIKFEALDLIGQLFVGYGSSLEKMHSQTVDVLLHALESQPRPNKKRAINALGFACPYLSDSLFTSILAKSIIPGLDTAAPNETIRTSVQLLATLANVDSKRVAEHVVALADLVIKCLENAAENAAENAEEMEPILEFCLQCYSTMLTDCKAEMKECSAIALEFGMKYLSYNPNFEDEMEIDAGDEDENEDDDDDEEDYSEDDDESYKIRLASAQLLNSVVLLNLSNNNLMTMSSNNKTKQQYCLHTNDLDKLVSACVARFAKETEETVSLELYKVAISIFKLLNVNEILKIYVLENGVLEKLITALKNQLNNKKEKSLWGCYSLLSELVLVFPGILNNNVDTVANSLQTVLASPTANSHLKSIVIKFILIFIDNHDSNICQSLSSLIITPLCEISSSHHYKIAGESLGVFITLIPKIRPHGLMEESLESQSNYSSSIFSCCSKLLNNANIDIEVKEKTISVLCSLLSYMSDLLNEEEKDEAFLILQKNMESETSRISVVQGLYLIASSPFSVELCKHLAMFISNLSAFIKKNNRHLKLESIKSLHAIINQLPNNVCDDDIEMIMKETMKIVDISDLQVAPVALNLWTMILKHKPSAASHLSLDSVFSMLHSPLLQGSVFIAVVKLVDIYSKCENNANFSTDEFLNKLIEPVYNYNTEKSTSGFINRREHLASAKCVAAVVNKNKGKAIEVTSKFVSDLQSRKGCGSNEDIAVCLLALSCIGEIGCTVDLSKEGDLNVDILSFIQLFFEVDNEEVKNTAAVALGLIACSNLTLVLPYIIASAKEKDKTQNALLISIREIVSYFLDFNVEYIKEFTSEIWTLLFEHCNLAEEGTRNVVGEIAGKLCLANASTDSLSCLLKSDNALIRGAAVAAVTFCVSHNMSTSTINDRNVDDIIKNEVSTALFMINDKDLCVRRVALVTMNSVAQNKPDLLKPYVNELMPILLQETKIDPKLCYELPMGPFTYKKDDGLDIRKTAFETMYTLLDWCCPLIDIDPFLSRVISGLDDEYDVKMITHLILVRFVSVAPHDVIKRLNEIIKKLIGTFQKALPKSDTQYQQNDIEKKTELIRSGMRAVVSFNKLPNSERHSKLTELKKGINDNVRLKVIYGAVLLEDD